ncbi:MAG: beta-galactosidase, partial [Paramuribaculum sp.]|nr:beta-galactosidase [Paramuribaculum sp.]
SMLKADGDDLSFINVRVVDKDGNLCPDATNKIRFKVSGKGTYHAAANGDPSSLESFQAPQMSAFHGQLTAIVKASETPGDITFTASAPGLKSATIKLKSE